MIRSVRSRTLVAIVALIILAFLVGLIFCFTFANRYYVNVKEKEMLNLYDSISSSYNISYQDREKSDEFYENEPVTGEPVTPDDDDDDQNYSSGSSFSDMWNVFFGNSKENKELAELCDETGISLMIMEPNGMTSFVYGNQDILTNRLNELVFDIDSDSENVEVVKSDGTYTIQTVTDKNTGDIEYIEMWGIFQSQRSFVARSSFSGIQNSIKVALYFFLFICVVILIIAAVIIYVLQHSYSKPLRRLVKATQGAKDYDFDEFYEGLGTEKRKDELGALGTNITQMSKQLYDSYKQLKNTNLKLRNELKAKESLDEQRKRYISDISHELKTPIALVSSYAEGLKEGIGATKEDQDYYLDVIIDESEKMNLMIKRISSLNKLEQKQADVNLERFDVVEVINGYLNTMALVFDEREIKVFFDNNNKIIVWADEFLFEEVLMNYLNNALNHVNEKKIIKVNVECEGKLAKVTVFNTGKNIPEEDLAKIWGEFYKVDKARTRAYGGSGLGLSIVKAISETVEQECGVYNTEDGVAFWFNLELDKVQECKKEKKKTGLQDLPIWQTTTSILKESAEKQRNERAEKKEKQAKAKAEKTAVKKEIAKEKAAQKKDYTKTINLGSIKSKIKDSEEKNVKEGEDNASDK